MSINRHIRKILVANRAEIAVRIINTARQMGISTVSIYEVSEQDMPHVSLATESYCLGEGDNLTHTYLDQEKIIKIALDTEVDAIHPGYGLLSENAEFAKRVQNAGLIFIGPSADIIAMMGDKIHAKNIMQQLGVPLIHGYHQEKQDDETLKKMATEIGVPLLIKASAGGGGKGMRLVEDLNEFSTLLMMCRSEALKAFGDDRVFLEKYITSPRHIEVQVFGDNHGQVVHLYERDCSIQRRHQKIIEQAPAPALSSMIREKICKTAVKIARHIGYTNAGTVEFILDSDCQLDDYFGKVDNSTSPFYFLEMNTRLQVEHPVTEMVTGIDLVRLQIEVASGLKIPFVQEQINIRGYAIEARLYAEDPDNNFYPTSGVIGNCCETTVPNVRFDNGYQTGNNVGVKFDPMLGKLISWGNSFQEAIEKMILSLNDCAYLGIKTNMDFLIRVLRHENFINGDISTRFIEKNEDDLFPLGIILSELSSNHNIAAVLATYYLANNLQVSAGRDKNIGSGINLSKDDHQLSDVWDMVSDKMITELYPSLENHT